MTEIVLSSDILVCPACGEENLHQESYRIFNRDFEDSDVGLNLHVKHLDVSISRTMSGNPSPRRDGIKISFSCECCDAEPVLTIIQHKGMTLVEWE